MEVDLVVADDDVGDAVAVVGHGPEAAAGRGKVGTLLIEEHFDCVLSLLQ